MSFESCTLMPATYISIFFFFLTTPHSLKAVKGLDKRDFFPDCDLPGREKGHGLVPGVSS